jgi:DNA-binding transcriptional LysR family regulator
MKIQDLNLSAVKYFLDAVEAQSISRSSEINHISRPAVSQAILKLGDWYGKPLLEHEKRSFVLTKAGEEFYKKAKQAFGNLQEVLIKDIDKENSLKLGCSASLLELVFPRLEKFLKKSENPILKFGPTDQLFQDLRQGHVNMIFVVDKNASSEFKAHTFHQGKFQVLSKDGKLSSTLITTEPRRETESLQKYFAKRKIFFQTHMVVESWTMAHRLAELGVGCCLIPDFIRTKELKAVKTTGWGDDYTASFYARKSHELSELERSLISSFL